jgi:hypothetical protein
MLISSDVTGMVVLFKMIHLSDQIIGLQPYGLVKNSTCEEKKNSPCNFCHKYIGNQNFVKQNILQFLQ